MANTKKPSQWFTSNNGETHIGKKWSKGFIDPTDGLANKYGLYVDIYRRQIGLNVRFKAFLTNFIDTFDMIAKEKGYIGEPDVLLKMQAMKRSFELAFDIPAANVFQAKLNLRNVSLLTKACYPTGKMAELDGGGTRWKPSTGGDPQFKIKFLNLITNGAEETEELGSSGPAQISGLRGYIDDLSYDFKLDADGGGWLFHPKEKGFAYPKVISLSFKFIPYFETTPGWFKTEDGYKFTQNSYPYGYKGVGKGEKTILEGSTTGATTETINTINKQRIDQALK